MSPARLLGLPWATATRVRAALYRTSVLPRRSLTQPTISVGALEMGGTGKTPAVAMLATLLRNAGRRPAILSRGYGRTGRGPRLVSTGAGPLLSARDSGDEPALYARALDGVVVAVAGPREQAAALASAADDIDLFLLDDAFQHLRVHRDVDLVMVDGRAPFYESSPPPLGRLREGVAAAARADAFLLTGDADQAEELRRRFPGRDVFRLSRSPVATIALEAFLAGEADAAIPTAEQPLFAFAGIARPERFFSEVAAHGRLLGQRAFADHHWYDEHDVQRLAAAAGRQSAVLVTTEKDAVRLQQLQVPPGVLVWRYRLEPVDAAGLLAWLQPRLERRGATR